MERALPNNGQNKRGNSWLNILHEVFPPIVIAVYQDTQTRTKKFLRSISKRGVLQFREECFDNFLWEEMVTVQVLL